MGVWLEGKPVADRIRGRIKDEVICLQRRTGRVPGLTGVLVGDNPASQSYLRMKEKACASLGLRGRILTLPPDLPPDRLKTVIDELNGDEAVDGILVQLPLPKGFDTQTVIAWIAPA